MILLVALALALFVLDAPWNWAVVVVGAVLEAGETGFWLWYTRRRRATVGVETLIGRRAVVVSALAPEGQVRLDGELWRARSAEPLAPGAGVVVRRIDGLTLDVEPE